MSPPGSGDVGGTVSPLPGCFLWQGSAGGHGGELQPAHRAVRQLGGAVHLQGWVGEETEEQKHGTAQFLWSAGEKRVADTVK